MSKDINDHYKEKYGGMWFEDGLTENVILKTNDGLALSLNNSNVNHLPEN